MINNNLKNTRRTLAVFAGLAATLSASAQVLFSDTNDSSTGEWYQHATGTGTPATHSHTTTDTTLTGGALSLAYTGVKDDTNFSTLLGRSFANTTLTTGQTLRFQFDFHLASGGSNASILRFGLYDEAGTTNTISANGFTDYDSATGYYTFVRNGSGAGNGLRFDKGTGAAPTFTPVTADVTNLVPNNTTNFAWGTTNAYTAIFDVTDTGSSNTVTASVFNIGNTSSAALYSISGTSAALSTFDGAFIRLDAAVTQTMNFDNLSVSVLSAVPEPATYAAWMGLGLLTLAVYRRRQS
jgi:hypothetical protein